LELLSEDWVGMKSCYLILVETVRIEMVFQRELGERRDQIHSFVHLNNIENLQF
jgi:hypothetical protein